MSGEHRPSRARHRRLRPRRTPRAAAGSSRIVDETIERGPSRARRAPPPTAPGAAAPAQPPADRPTAAAGAADPPAAPQPPSPAELLRFRDRLERAARELTHDYDELLGRLSYAAVATTTGPTISFARGAPSLDIVDVDGLRDAAVRAFESDPAGTTAYGTAVGYPRLRSWIADRHGVEPERVLVTNGSMQADAFLFEQLVRPGDEVIVERPTYDRTLLSLRQRGAHAARGGAAAGRHRHGRTGAPADGGLARAADARAHHPQLPEPGGVHAVV